MPSRVDTFGAAGSVRGVLLLLLLSAAAPLLRVAPAAAQPPLDEARAFADTLSPDGAIRIAATESLARIRTFAARARLVQMAQADGDPRVRVSAVRLLGSSYDPGVVHLFPIIAANDPDPGVRAAAAEADAQAQLFSKRPASAAAFSLLCPGCGYFYLRQPGRAAVYLGATAAFLGTSLAALAGGGELEPTGKGPRMRPTTAPLALPALTVASGLWSYGVFASYRDARLRRGDEGYRYPVSREGLTDLVSAPFRPSVLSRPWFWAGLPVLFGAALGLTFLIDPEQPSQNMRSLRDGGGVWFLGRRYGTRTGFALGEAYYAGLFTPVAAGEEALFRGALQPGLSEMLGLWPGWALTSAIFGAAHIGNFTDEEGGLAVAARAIPFIALGGSYLGLCAIKTGFRLETSVAVHFWYDFLLGTTAFILDPDNQPFALRFGRPF